MRIERPSTSESFMSTLLGGRKTSKFKWLDLPRPSSGLIHYTGAHFGRVQKSSKRKSAETVNAGLTYFLFRGSKMEMERKLHALLQPVVGCCITYFTGMVFSFAFGQNEDRLDIGTFKSSVAWYV